MNIKMSSMFPSPWPWFSLTPHPSPPRVYEEELPVPFICEWLQTCACVHWKLWEGVRGAAHKWCSYSFKVVGLIPSLSTPFVQKCNIFFCHLGRTGRGYKYFNYGIFRVLLLLSLKIQEVWTFSIDHTHASILLNLRLP